MIDHIPMNDVYAVFNAANEVAAFKAEEVGAIVYSVDTCTFTTKTKGTCKAFMDASSDIGFVRDSYKIKARIRPGGITATAGKDYWTQITKSQVYEDLGEPFFPAKGFIDIDV